jgi:hypothetical protein
MAGILGKIFSNGTNPMKTQKKEKKERDAQLKDYFFLYKINL